MVDGIFWVGFIALVIVLLALDLGIFNKKEEGISLKKAIWLSAFWITIGLAFGIFVFFEFGPNSATAYYAGYIVEKAMSVDNLFVFLIVFSCFAVPDKYQHKALFFGIIGALVFRAIFIFAGVALLETFEWMMILFGAILIFTAIRTVMKKDGAPGEDTKMVKWVKKTFRVSDGFDGDKFFTKKTGILMATPLLLAVIVLEATDLIFAIDSVPAVLAITTDTFIVYTSNVFAILGLRALYFALRGAVQSLEYLKYGLAIILTFVGAKMMMSFFGVHIDVITSLAVILGVLVITVALSLFITKKKAHRQGGMT